MDAAYLHNSIFNIESKRRELEEKKIPHEEIRRLFNRDYRAFSKKNAFTCLDCHSPVIMNITKDEGTAFYFRHKNSGDCSYSSNTKTYEKHVSKLENKSKKDIGLTVFREILEGELKPYHVRVERGYHYKKKLTFIPDFILTFPNSEERWAVDYFAAMDQGINSRSYTDHLARRMEVYKKEGFKIFSFVDYRWISFLEETNKGTLMDAEIHVTSKSQEDKQWDTFLNENVQDELLRFFIDETRANMNLFNTSNIAYVDVTDRTCTIFRFLPIVDQGWNITYYKLSNDVVPLAQALTLSADHKRFLLSNGNEEVMRQDFLKLLVERKEQFDLNLKRASEERTEKKREKEKKETYTKVEVIDHKGIINSADEDVEREMRERARRAAARPVDVHPDFWDSQSYKKSKSSNYDKNNESIKSASSKDHKKRNEIKELLLSQPIEGEVYINSDNRIAWRLVILKWIKENQSNSTLVVSLDKVISYMKSAEISFHQNEKLVKYPVRYFLEFYVKTMEKELRKKVELTFNE